MRSRPFSDRTDVAAARHAATSSSRRPLLHAGVVVTLGLGALTTGVAVTRGADAQPCPTDALDVVASPQLAPVVARTAEALGSRSGCSVADVTAAEPAEVLRRLAAGSAARPDVWVPDSSVWLDRAARAGVVLPGSAPSVATSPVVLAAPARGPGFAEYVAQRPAAPLGLASPRESAVALGVVLAVRDATATRPDGRLAVTGTLRSSIPQDPGGALADRLDRADGAAVAASAQEVAALEAARPGTATAIALPRPGMRLDNPWAVLTGDVEAVSAADALLTALRDEGARPLEEAGFDPPADRSRAGVPSPQEADAAVRTLEVVLAPSRMLAVVDVSGSMGLPVPGASGATRVELARDGALQGLDLFPDDTVVGLWAFSTELTPTSDHVELVPLTALGAGPDGVTGRERLRAAVREVRHVPGGDTGLYDTALAAVRAVRGGYDPARVNSVVLLSDGRNDDDRGIGVDELLTTLQREADPARPVPVITIAYGPDSDAAAMAAISRTTGGAAYAAEDPRDIRRVFLDAVGQRTCRPTC